MEGLNMENVSMSRRQGDGTDSRGGRKRHAGTLPSCQVCFNPGSGFHYGADTCEPCKTFFRRNVSLKGKLECRRGNSCKPSPTKKFKCTACRLNRCFKVGMSLEGIKLGRYTDSKRAMNKAIDFESPISKPQASSVPLSPPDMMTPPDTPPDDTDGSTSPKSGDPLEVGKSEPCLDSEFNKTMNYLSVANEVENIQMQSQHLSFQNNYLVEDLSGPTEPLSHVKQDTNFDFSLGSTLNTGFCQKGQFLSNDLDPIALTFQPMSQANMLQTNSLLDSILYDNVPGPQMPQPLSLGPNVGLDMSMVAMGGNGLANINNDDTDINPSSSFTDLTLNQHARFQNTAISTTQAKMSVDTTTTSRSSVTVLESPLTAIQSTVASSTPVTQTPPAQSELPIIPSPISGTTSIFLDTFIDHITNIYTHYDAHGSDFFRQIHKMFFDYLETQSMKKRMFGSMRPLPLPEYRQILMETGLDVDGRLQLLTHRQLPSYEKGYSLYLNFVKDVPGFRDIPTEDQDVLIKGGRIDYWMLSEFDCFNIEMGLHAFPDGFVLGVEDKALLLERQYIKSMFKTADKFQKLGLSERERNLLKCIYIFSRASSCSTPEGKATTEKHYSFFRQVLQYCRDREGRLGESNEMDEQLDPLMKDLGKLEESDWEQFFSLWKDFPMIKFPPVTKSFYFGSPTSDHNPPRVS